uniref:Uncharacterized protein n=1 Tax=Arundo donax TaxID=35708 RepID=A0A0A9T4B4_ARUDO
MVYHESMITPTFILL